MKPQDNPKLSTTTNITRKEMIETCSRCGKKFKDDYIHKNTFNKRIYCNECVEELWEKKRSPVRKWRW